MQTRKVKIKGTGKYLPEKIVYAEDLDKKLGLSPGWTASKSGVLSRRYAGNETTSQMGALATTEALKDAKLSIKDIDCIIAASGVSQQAIPCTASLIQKELGKESFGIPCFDVNATCLSFVTALDLISGMIELGKYNNVLIVSSEITSIALDWDDPKSCTLFGDGAAAVIVGKTPDGETSQILASDMQTYGEGSSFAEIKAGGSRIHPETYTQGGEKDFLFHMDGLQIYKLASKCLPKMIENVSKESGLNISDLDLVIPHQASLLAMKLTQKNLNIKDGKFMYIIEDHGNIVAASIPMALHEAIKRNIIKRGSKVMLLGTSAGLSVGGLIFEY
jgi:3-oxoacyl-[acyl-carrier-protein] synthase III